LAAVNRRPDHNTPAARLPCLPNPALICFPAAMRRCLLWLFWPVICLGPAGGVIASVELHGVRGEIKDNVLAHLELDDAPCDLPSWRLRRVVRQAEPQIRRALEAYGYYSAAIALDSSAVEGCWVTRITIDIGLPVLLRTVDIRVIEEDVPNVVLQKLLRSSPLRPGDALRHSRYDSFKQALADTARQQGYFAGAWETSRLEVFAAQRAADVTLVYRTGPRYRFGAVDFEQDVVAERLVRRFVDFPPGAPYDGEKITGLYNALIATGYFATIDVQTTPGTPPDLDVPVTVHLTAAKRKVYTTGIGYSTDIGPKVRAGYSNRRVNDRGHQFDANLSVSPVLSEAGVSYRVPRDDPRVEWLHFDAGFQYEDTDTSRTETYKTGVKEFRRRGANWIETRFLDLSLEEFTIAGETDHQFLVIPGISWSHATIENVPRPRRGHRFSFKLSGTHEAIGSDSQFLQSEVFGKLILPAWPGGRVLARGEIGATAKEEFRTLPASVRFFAGGDYSVRGYDYESLGPTDENGAVIGGSHRVTASVELDQLVFGNWSVAAFADTGNAFDRFGHMALKTGVGGGIRWYSPLGPVRFDIAVPLDDDAPDSYRIHVTLGPDL
jgi:translocation and assembly module TamA